MSTNSQKTEDMLDQTFANFDSEVTGADNDDDNDDGGSPSSEPTKKKSSNMMVFIGAGIAAVGAIAYMFVFKPMMEPPPVKRPPIVAKAPAPVAPAAQEPVAPPAPVVAEPVVPPTAPVVAQVDPQEANKQLPINTGSVTEKNPLDAAMSNNSAPVSPVKEEPIKAGPTLEANPQINKAIATVDELKSMFEQQTTEFRTVLTNIDDRVVRIESLLQQQKDINVKFDERLVALETGRKVMPQASEEQSSVKTVVKKAAKKKAVNNNDDIKPVSKHASKSSSKSASKYSETEPTETGVVLDKSSVEQKEKVAINNLPRLSLHSIYAGRIWIKNEDGSLSTYIAGDKLPTGEVIKKVDDENFEVSTNKRVIKY